MGDKDGNRRGAFLMLDQDLQPKGVWSMLGCLFPHPHPQTYAHTNTHTLRERIPGAHLVDRRRSLSAGGRFFVHVMHGGKDHHGVVQVQFYWFHGSQQQRFKQANLVKTMSWGRQFANFNTMQDPPIFNIMV
eukprot:1150478-Pelagomonas_calceolata.AAC.12